MGEEGEEKEETLGRKNIGSHKGKMDDDGRRGRERGKGRRIEEERERDGREGGRRGKPNQPLEAD